MEVSSGTRGRGLKISGASRRPHSKNKQWVAGQDGTGHGSDGERWERGGPHRGRGGRGRHSNMSTHLGVPHAHEDAASGTDEEGHSGMEEDEVADVEDKDPETPEEREKFYQELVKAREIERKHAIATGKMDDPLVPKRLDEAITMVGTCVDMCPRFERYRRERENNLDKWEVIPGTKRVDHKRAVKIYERAAGDKTLPSDLRPPPVLKKTLDYLFHDLMERGGFSQTYGFIRDRSRAVRSDFVMQHETGPLAIECHDRCARFHIVALHLERDSPGFSIALEEQQLMNTLQSLKEYYEDQRGRYSAPTELEMRVYHRLIHIRDQKERHEEIPEAITSHPVFKLTTQFRLHVQEQSAPISKTSALRVDARGMEIFGQLAAVLREQNNVVMIYLVACIMERLFGKETIEDIEAIRGDLTISEIIDGISRPVATIPAQPATSMPEVTPSRPSQAEPVTRSATEWLTNSFGPKPTASAFLGDSARPPQAINGVQTAGTTSAPSSAPAPAISAFSTLAATPNVFGGPIFGSTSSSAFGGSGPKSVFGPAVSAPAPAPEAQSFGFPSKPAASPFGPSLTQPASAADIRPSQTNGAAFAQPANVPPTATFPTTSNATDGVNVITPATALPPPGASSVLNPQAAAFAPPSGATLFGSVPSFPTSSQAPTPSRPATQPDIPPLQIPPTTSPFAAAVPPPSTSTPQLTETQTPPPRIVDRRQTLWNIPSSAPSTPPSQDRAPQTPTSATRPSFPPPPPKPQNLSLPPTPTAHWFDPSSLPQASSSTLLRKQSILNLQTTGHAPAEILSPLHLSSSGGPKTPSALTESPTPPSRLSEPTASTSRIQPEPTLLTMETEFKSPSKIKGKLKKSTVDLDELALAFARKSLIVKHSFKTWMKKTADRAAWAEAIQRSDAYKQKVERQRLSNSVSSAPSRKPSSAQRKHRISLGASSELPHLKRSRRRVSSEYRPPLTDEDLVRRLKENQEEHQRRWAQGSFLQAVRERVRQAAADQGYPPEWCIWLSMNTENDGTAIWLEHKFDVPQSGDWVAETVFSIPISPGSHDPHGFPGMIVFERTPLEGLNDAIERKYRELDDCARLRDLAEMIQRKPKLRYAPALLVITWDAEGVVSTPDFGDMTKKLAQEGVVGNMQTLLMSSTAHDLDKKFEDALATIDIDTEDQLSLSTSWEDLSSFFTAPFRTHASDWIHSCWTGEHFDWSRYGEVLRAIEQVQTTVLTELLTLVGEPSDARVQMPVDLEAPAHLGPGYATGSFLDACVKLPIATAEEVLGDRVRTTYIISREQLEAASHRLDATLQSLSARLRELAATALFTSTPSKRPAPEDESVTTSPSSTHKRMKRSPPELTSEQSYDVVEVDTNTNGLAMSPPPSSAPASTVGASGVNGAQKPLVTIAMLRALAQDVLKSR